MKYLLYAILFFTVSCAQVGANPVVENLLFENDENGGTLAGHKQTLINHIKNGGAVRIVIFVSDIRTESFSSRRLVILGDNVFVANRLEMTNFRYDDEESEIKFTPNIRGPGVFGTDGKEVLYLDAGYKYVNKFRIRWFAQ